MLARRPPAAALFAALLRDGVGVQVNVYLLDLRVRLRCRCLVLLSKTASSKSRGWKQSGNIDQLALQK